MRSRNIKPGFFKNEDIADCDPYARLLFIGMWCLADREGRLEYRPKRIKAEIFPYDKVDIDKMMEQLTTRGFVFLYGNGEYLQVVNFKKHQNCHIKEQESTIQAPCLTGVDLVQAGNKPEQAHPLTESPLPLTESPLLITKTPPADFLTFWKEYPNKVEKQYALKCWRKLNGQLPEIKFILDAIKKQILWRENANGQFRPEWKAPATWLNKGCWDDEVTVIEPLSDGEISEWGMKP